MTGQQLKDKLTSANVSFADVAEKLGITPQSLNSTFKVQDVRSNTLERIAAVLGVDMGFFYPIAGGSVTTNIKKQSAHNLHQGTGDITEKTADNETLRLALQQNAELIALLKAEKGL